MARAAGIRAGRAFVELSINSTALQRGLQRAQRMASQFGAALRQVGAIGAAGIGLVAGALTALAARSMSAIDATAKTADALGITTQQLASYRHAAELAGISTDVFDKALGRMLVNVGRAKDGTGEAAAALESLGLSASDLEGLDTGAQFALISDRLSKVASTTDRATAAYRIFGREGIKIAAMSRSGAEGLAQAAAEADRLGIAVSRVDAAKVEAANDAMTRARAAVMGLGNAIAVQVAPVVEHLAMQFVAVATEGGGAAKVVETGFSWAVGAVALVADTLELLKAGFHAVRAAANFALAGVVSGIGTVAQALEALLNAIPGVEVQFTEVFGLLADNLRDAASESAKAASDAFGAWQQGDAGRRVAESIFDIQVASERAALSQAKLADEFRKSAQSLAMLGEEPGESQAVKAYRDEVERLNTAIRTFGFSDADRLVDKLGQMGVSNEQIDSIRRLQAELAKLENQDIIAKLETELAQIGMSDLDRRIAEFSAREGVTPEQIKRFTDLATELDRRARQQDAPSEMLARGGFSAAALQAIAISEPNDAERRIATASEATAKSTKQIANTIRNIDPTFD